MNENYKLREQIWENFYSKEAIRKLNSYINNLFSQGRTESEIERLISQHLNEYWQELKKIGLEPEDHCIHYGEYEIDAFDNDLTISNNYNDPEILDSDNYESISLPMKKEIIVCLINDLLKYHEKGDGLKLKEIDNIRDIKKGYAIEEFKEHIHLYEGDKRGKLSLSEFVSIPIFSSKLTPILKKLVNIYKKIE